MKQETVEKHIEDLRVIKGDLISRSLKLHTLRSKLFVEYSGDVMQGNFTLRFNQFPQEQNSIQLAILDKFVEDYGLDMDKEIRKIDDCISLMEAVVNKKNFCEVDLLDMSKPPVSC